MDEKEQQSTQMIDVSVEVLAGCKRLIRVEVPAVRVRQVYDETVKEISKHVRLPGFRPGKAPRSVIERTFGDELRQETQNRLIRETLKEALEKHSLQQLTREEVEVPEPLHPDRPFFYVATLEVYPEFELPDYRQIPVQIEERQVTEQDIERAFRVLQEGKATYQTVDRPIKEGDVAVISFRGSLQGGRSFRDIDEKLAWLDGQEEFWLKIEPEQLIPGFALQLLGARAGEKRQVNLQIPPDFQVQALAGERAQFEVEIRSVREKVLPEINEEFAKSYGAENLERLRQGVIADLQRELQHSRKRRIREQLVAALLGRASFELPESLVQAETRDIVYDIVRTQAERGLTKEEIDARRDEIYSVASRSARDRVKLRFLLLKIAEKENVKVTDQELTQRVYYLSRVYKIPVTKFVRELQRTGGLRQIYEEILMDKVLDVIEKYAVIQPVAG